MAGRWAKATLCRRGPRELRGPGPPDLPGCFYFAVFLDLHTDSTAVEYTKRRLYLNKPVLAEMLRDYGLVPAYDWVSQPATGRIPWYITHPRAPGRSVLRRWHRG
jgi:hypothetical protein